jgi:bifunctional non-homologous end joining protein LigD
MLALAVTKLPEGRAWAYELKFDGYRALSVEINSKVRLFSRSGNDFTVRFASIAGTGSIPRRVRGWQRAVTSM